MRCCCLSTQSKQDHVRILRAIEDEFPIFPGDAEEFRPRTRRMHTDLSDHCQHETTEEELPGGHGERFFVLGESPKKYGGEGRADGGEEDHSIAKERECAEPRSPSGLNENDAPKPDDDTGHLPERELLLMEAQRRQQQRNERRRALNDGRPHPGRVRKAYVEEEILHRRLGKRQDEHLVP